MPMTDDTYPVLYWVCADCESAESGTTEDERAEPYSREYPPMERVPVGLVVTFGMMADEHDSDCANFGEWIGEECSCERREFVRSSCDGCGSPCAGYRAAVTVWHPVPTDERVSA